MKNKIQAVCLLFSLLTHYGVASAEIPGFEKTVALNASGESANEFVRTLFSQVGVPVKIESEIGGSVYGSFEGTAADVFAQISKTYNVHAYFNRQIAYVYRAEDISERLMPMSNKKAAALKSVATEMGMIDSRNTIYLVKGAGIEVVGNTRFIKKIEELANSLKVEGKPKRKAESTPKTGAGAQQFIVREFKLKYASVVDKSQTISGYEVNIPGVASMLRQFINRNRLPTEIVADQSASEKNATQFKQEATKFKRSKPSGVQPRIMAFPQTNSIWIEDTVDRIAIYASMIEAMDQAPRMVEIEATIIDINNSRQRELGINWRSNDNGNELFIGDGTAQGINLNPGQAISAPVNGGILSLVLGNRENFIARIRALEELGAAKVVSTPHVITNSSVEAILGATTEVPIRLEGIEAVSLEEKSFGTVLRVTPRVLIDGSEDVIDLMISIEDGKTSGRFFDNIPEIERSVVGTQAMIVQGQSLLIGGLMRESTEDSTSQVPILSRIPGIGGLFRSPTKRITKTERLFLITPRIVGADQDALTGPVLRGKIKDIVATSDRRNEQARDEVFLKSQRQTHEVNGPSAFSGAIETVKKAAQTAPIELENVVKTELSELLVIPVLDERTEDNDVLARANEQYANTTLWRVRNAKTSLEGWQVISQ